MILLKYYSSGESKVYRVGYKGCYEGLGFYGKIPWNLPFIKRVLLLGRESLYVTVKRFPLLSSSELRKVIGYQLPEFVPFEEPEFGFRIMKRGENFLEVKIWAWERKLTNELSKDFFFSYVLPEEELFRAKELTIFVLKKEKGYLFVASENYENIQSLFLKPPVTEGEIKIFLKGIKKELTEIKKVFLYGLTKEDSEALLPSMLKALTTYRASLVEDLPSLIRQVNLRHYKLKKTTKAPTLEESLRFVARFSIILAIAVEANLLFSSLEYGKAIRNLKEELSRLERARQPLIQNGSHKEKKHLDLLEEVNAHLKYSYFPFMHLLNALAEILPEGSRLTDFQLSEGVATINVECSDPEEIIKRFRANDLLKDVRLKRPPILDQRSNIQRIELEIDLRGKAK